MRLRTTFKMIIFPKIYIYKYLTNNPNENYNILEEKISNSLDIHMNKKKTVKFNSRKHTLKILYSYISEDSDSTILNI